MMSQSYIGKLLVVLILSFAFAGPAMAGKKQRNTVIGVGIGALAGSLLSNGDPWATVGGAVAGGVIGNVTTHDRDHRGNRYYDSRYDNRRYNDRRYNDRHDRRRGNRDWDDRHRW